MSYITFLHSLNIAFINKAPNLVAFRVHRLHRLHRVHQLHRAHRVHWVHQFHRVHRLHRLHRWPVETNPASIRHGLSGINPDSMLSRSLINSPAKCNPAQSGTRSSPVQGRFHMGVSILSTLPRKMCQNKNCEK